MSELSLSAYEEQIDEFLEEGAYDDVIVWGQHLLQKFPKCLSGYRYLAQAALERGQREEAMDLFRRLLSADPEDFVAYAGLAAIYHEDNVYDEAIWHMMRTFELRPDNPVVREQLRDLYEAKDGRRPGRLKLNPPALGRIYLRNGEYTLAASEFATQLDEDPDRIDLRMARAVALWRAGRRQEAVEESERVLEELPNALRARLLLGQFYAEEGKTDRAAEHLQYARALDPSNSMAQSLFGEESVLPTRKVTLTTPYAEEAVPADVDDEGDYFGMDEDFVGFAEPDMAEWGVVTLPVDWRADLREATEEALADVPEPVDVPAEPFWVQSLRDATERALDTVPTVEEEVEPEPADVPVAPEPQPAAPDWRADLRETTEAELEQWEPPAVAEEPAVVEEAPQVSEPEQEPEVPAPQVWHADLREATENELAAASHDVAAIEEEAPPTPDIETEIVSDLESTSAWHEELRTDTGDAFETATPEEAPVEEEERTVAWRADLREVTGHVLADAVEAPGVEAEAPEEMPSPWRGNLRDTTGEALDGVEARREYREPTPEPEPDVVGEAREPERELPADPLARAKQLADAGDDTATLDAFQAVFDADDGRDEELAAAMREWVETGVDSGGPHQLLGDVYRRMGRLQDAVEEYRIALQKT